MALKGQDWFYNTTHYRAGASCSGYERVLCSSFLAKIVARAVTEVLFASTRRFVIDLGHDRLLQEEAKFEGSALVRGGTPTLFMKRI